MIHSKEHAAIVLVALAADLLLVAGLCLRWPERLYETRRIQGLIWMLMGLWFIPRTDENSVQFARSCLIVASTLTTLGTLAAIVFFYRR